MATLQNTVFTSQNAPNKRRFPSVYAGTTAALKKTLDHHHTQTMNSFSASNNTEKELDYFVNTASIVFNYYDIVENSTADEQQDLPAATQNTNSILKYFAPKQETASNSQEPARTNLFRNDNRASLLEQYMCKTTPSYVRNASILQSTATSKLDENVVNMCEYCGSLDRTSVIHDGIIICNECATVEYILVDHERPSYKEPPKEVSYFAYKRINHLNEWLNQVQGKETTEVPEEIYDKIFYEIKKRKITNMREITHQQLRGILRKLGSNKYYEHTAHIVHRLNGLPVPTFPPELEEKIRVMFKQVQVPFLKHAPANRKNFCSYSYILAKFMQLLEKDEYLPYFPLLKSREKLQAQDNIWKKICEDLSWQFIASLWWAVIRSI